MINWIWPKYLIEKSLSCSPVAIRTTLKCLFFTLSCLSHLQLDHSSILWAASTIVQFVQCGAFDMQHACTYGCRKYWTSWKCDKYCTRYLHARNMTNIRQTFAPVSRTVCCWRTQPRIGRLTKLKKKETVIKKNITLPGLTYRPAQIIHRYHVSLLPWPQDFHQTWPFPISAEYFIKISDTDMRLTFKFKGNSLFFSLTCVQEPWWSIFIHVASGRALNIRSFHPGAAIPLPHYNLIKRGRERGREVSMRKLQETLGRRPRWDATRHHILFLGNHQRPSFYATWVVQV